jgi:hypothetical protein
VGDGTSTPATYPVVVHSTIFHNCGNIIGNTFRRQALSNQAPSRRYLQRPATSAIEFEAWNIGQQRVSDVFAQRPYHRSIINFCRCVTERTSREALSIERSSCQHLPSAPGYRNHYTMSVTISKRLTDEQKVEFDAFMDRDPTDWERHNKELLEKVSCSHIQIKGFSS